MTTSAEQTCLQELRVLEGPNLYFPRPTIKLTLNLSRLTHAPVAQVRALADGLGVRSRPGEPGGGFRQRALARLVSRLVRRVAAEAGVSRLGVRVRATSDPDCLIVAYPWRNRGRGRALGEAVAAVIDQLDQAHDGDGVATLVSSAGQQVAAADLGERPHTVTPRIPLVAVTGTNGKTTTSRMIARIAQHAGYLVGWSNTDGVYRDGKLVEPGDYSGPSGAGRVLAQPGVNFAVTETARGGILLKGIGVTKNDVSVVTNVSADHLGMQGIDTVDQLAEVKSVVPSITRQSGWAVLNADDPRVLHMRGATRATPWVFSRDPDSPGIREVLDDGGRATSIIDGEITVLYPHADPQPILPVIDVPMTLSGLSRFNVENALAAASAALAMGIDTSNVVAGLRSFRPDIEHNPGRMNMYSLDGRTVVMDLAHNEAGLEAMVEIMRGVRPAGAQLLLGIGVVGDRQDDLIEMIGEIAARDADVVVIGHKERYLRGRPQAELDELLRAGAARVGVDDVASYDTELSAVQALLDQAQPGDVVGIMCHAERQEVHDWVTSHGGSADTPEVLRSKVIAAQDDSAGGV